MRDTKNEWRNRAFLLSGAGGELHAFSPFADISKEFFASAVDAMAAWNEGLNTPVWTAFNAECQKVVDDRYHDNIDYGLFFRIAECAAAASMQRINAFLAECPQYNEPVDIVMRDRAAD